MSEPVIEWTKQLGTSSSEFSYGIVTDSNGNVYITGYTEGDLDGTNQGGYDAFVVKFDSGGNEVWRTQVGTALEDGGLSIAIDSNGNVYITGITKGELDGTNQGGYDTFVVKFDSGGTEVWRTQLGTSGSDSGRSIATDSNDNVYITGRTTGVLDGENKGGWDIFVVKFDSGGTEVWRTQLGSSSGDLDQANGIAIDSNDNVYIAGFTRGALDGTNPGGADAIVVKYDTDGTEVWITQVSNSHIEEDVDFGGGSDAEAFSIAIDSHNNVYITGKTNGDFDGDNLGSSDIFVVKFDTGGTEVWRKQLGSGGAEQGNGIAIDSNNNVYITGMTEGVLSGTNQGSHDAFVVKFDSGGNEVWRTQLGTTGREFVWCLAIDLNDNVYISGGTTGDFDGTNQGAYDAFVVKYSVEEPNTGYQFVNVNELQTAVNLWVSDKSSALSTYGEINTWDTSLVTSMNGLFSSKTTFNDDISNWNTSNVTNMGLMFQGCTNFDQSVSNWNTSNVTNMNSMFQGCTSFNQPVSNFDTSNVTDMSYMFYNCTNFNQTLSNFDTSNVTIMYFMFSGCTSFNSPVNFNDTSNVTSMFKMFDGCTNFNQTIEFNTSNVTHASGMASMFANCTIFNQDIRDWTINVSSNRTDMFLNATAMINTYTGVSGFGTTPDAWFWNSINDPEPNTGYQFVNDNELQTGVNLWVSDKSSALSTYGEINTWDTSLVTSMYSLFKDKNTFNDDISNWNTSNVTNMNYMFIGCGSFNQPVSDFNTSNVTDMGFMFAGCTSFDQPVSNFDTSKVTTMNAMFYNCTSFNQPVSNFDTSNVAIMSSMFQGCTSFNQPVSNFDTSNLTSMNAMFYNCTSFNQPVSNFDTSNVTDMSYMFFICTGFNQTVSNFDTSNVTNMYGMFVGCGSFNQPVSDFNTSNVTNMTSMFTSCTSFNQPVSNFDTSNVTNMSSMFQVCTSFNQPVSNFDTSNVTDITGMFSDCTSFNQPVSNFDTSNVTSMNGMFAGCTSFNQPVSNFDTSNVTNMIGMFNYCTSFNQPVSNFDTSKVTRMHYMFNGCTNFNQTIEFNTSNVTHASGMNSMFANCTNFNSPVNFNDTSNVTHASSMASMFANCTNFNQDIRDWTINVSSDRTDMFLEATAMINTYTGVSGFGTTPDAWFWNGINEPEPSPEPEPEPISITISLTKGINGIYITKDGNLTNVTGLYIYEYDGIYSNALNILEGSVNISTGSYFIKTNVTTDITYNYQGELPTSINIDVTQGWNVIGWNSNNINLRATLTDNTNIIETNTLQIYETINNIYTLESNYSNLKPNVAYWVKCTGSGQLIITPNT